MPEMSVLLDGYGVGTTQGYLGLCSLVLIEGQQRVLVDVGHAGRRGAALDALERHGLVATDIDLIVLTHAHWDHVQNLDVFPSARVLVHAAERRYARRPHADDWATPAWTGAMLDHYTERFVEVEDGHVVEPGVEIMHTPGHSVGSISVVVRTTRGTAVASGDALQFARTALTGRNPVVFWDDEAARLSIARILDVADEVYPGHDRPFRLPLDGRVDYIHDFELTLVGVRADQRGLRFDAQH